MRRRGAHGTLPSQKRPLTESGLPGALTRPRYSEAGGRQALTLRLAAPPNQTDLAAEYALASAPKGRAYVFAEAENSTDAQLVAGIGWAAAK